MTQIRVNSIQSLSNTAVIVSYGASIPSSGIITGAGGINVTGIVTASSFSGNGSGLTNINLATRGRSIAYSLIT